MFLIVKKKYLVLCTLNFLRRLYLKFSILVLLLVEARCLNNLKGLTIF
jgi:hypothetical protein